MYFCKRQLLTLFISLISSTVFAATVENVPVDVFHIVVGPNDHALRALPLPLNSLMLWSEEIGQLRFLTATFNSKMQPAPVDFLGTKDSLFLMPQQVDPKLGGLPTSRILMDVEAAKDGNHIALLIFQADAIKQAKDLIKTNPAHAYAVLSHNFDLLKESPPGTIVESLHFPASLTPTPQPLQPKLDTDGSESIAAALLAEKKRSGNFDPLRIKIPKDILFRPTRLQALLRKNPVDDLKKLDATNKNPHIQELLSESKTSAIHWRPFRWALDYVEYFSLDDLIYMAAHKKYANTVADELRTYANSFMHGEKHPFRNDQLYPAARVLIDRWRIMHEGFPAISTDAQLKTEAEKAGTKLQTKSYLYLVSALPAEEMRKAKTIRNPQSPIAASLLEVYSHGNINSNKEKFPSSFLGLDDQGRAEGATEITVEEAKKILTDQLKSQNNAPNDELLGLRQSINYLGEPLNKIITKIDSASMGFQYEIKGLAAVNYGTFSRYWITHEVPISKVTRYRRFYDIRFSYKHQTHSTGEGIRTGHLMVPEEWRDFNAKTADKNTLLKTKNASARRAPLPLEGKTIVFIGDLSSLTLTEAIDKVKALGGKVSNSLSSKTNYVVEGHYLFNSGSKRIKARELGIPLLSEKDFLKLISAIP